MNRFHARHFVNCNYFFSFFITSVFPEDLFAIIAAVESQELLFWRDAAEEES